jgi:hypothetical protein
MKNIVTLLGLVFISINILTAQHQNVMISASNVPEEPSIYVNPNNPDHIVGGANIKNYYYSNDGGYTWVGGVMSSSYGVYGDPCLITDTANNVYFFHLAWPSFGSAIDRIVCQKSTDGGATWNDGSYMGLNGDKVQDKEWAVVDRTNREMYGTVMKPLKGLFRLLVKMAKYMWSGLVLKVWYLTDRWIRVKHGLMRIFSWMNFRVAGITTFPVLAGVMDYPLPFVI